MGKKILTFQDLEIEKKIFLPQLDSCVQVKDVGIVKVLVTKNTSFGEKTIITLLVTCIMVIKLNHYIQCFLKQALM